MEEIKLPENASRKLADGEKYIPVLRPENNYPEVTPYSVSLGVVMAVVFSAAAAYLGLKVGQVFEAAIPIAIIAVGLSSALRRKNALGENVIIQSIGASSGVSRALYLAGEVSRHYRQLYAGVYVKPARRMSRHTVPYPLQKILRAGEARRISFP